MKGILVISFALSAFYCAAQSAFTEYKNDFTLRINSNGMMAVDLANGNAAFNEEGTSNHYLNQAGIWILAEDFSGNFYSAVHHYDGIDSFDFWPGPVDIITGQTGDIDLWDNTWEVDNALINTHISNFQNTNYVVPDAIKNWPANGGNGYNDYLAAFIDANTNGVYDPENGDYPYIKGNKAVYCIFNDLANEHKASLGSEVGVEVYLMAYTGEISSNVYLEYFIISRTSTAYKNVKVGFFMGGEVGNINDNYVGSSGSQQASIDVPTYTFVYQGDDDDEGHFGTKKPLIYAANLNQPITSTISFTNGVGSNGLPTETVDYQNYMNGQWLDGSSLTYGNNGQDAQGIEHPYIYDHNFGGGPMWTEENSGSTPGVRNILSMADFGPLNRNEHIKYDVLLGVEPDFTEDKAALNGIIYNALWEERGYSSVNQPVKINPSIFPNPNNGRFTISPIFSEEFDMQIVDFQGIVVHVDKLRINQDTQCNVSLAPGIYRIQLTNRNSTYNLPMIVTD